MAWSAEWLVVYQRFAKATLDLAIRNSMNSLMIGLLLWGSMDMNRMQQLEREQDKISGYS